MSNKYWLLLGCWDRLANAWSLSNGLTIFRHQVHQRKMILQIFTEFDILLTQDPCFRSPEFSSENLL